MLILITDRRDFGRTLSAHLREGGIFLIQCPTEVALFTCEHYDTGGVVLDASTDLHAAELLCASLRKHYPALPIAVIALPEQIPELEAERVLRDRGVPADTADEIAAFYRVDCGWNLPVFSVYRLSTGIQPGSAVYMGYPLRLPPAEHMLLRFLFYRISQVTSVQEILTVCFPDGTQSRATVSVHVANINRLAAEIDPRPLIVNVYGKGYRLRDGLK